MYKKVYGLFKALPLESLKIDFICRLTNSDKETIHPILKKLVKNEHIVGIRSYRLKKVPKHILNIP